MRPSPTQQDHERGQEDSPADAKHSAHKPNSAANRHRSGSIRRRKSLVLCLRTHRQHHRRIQQDEREEAALYFAGVADGVRREVETVVKSQAERFVADMDLVKREDFDVLRELVQAQGEEIAALRKELAGLKPKKKAE